MKENLGKLREFHNHFSDFCNPSPPKLFFVVNVKKRHNKHQQYKNNRLELPMRLPLALGNFCLSIVMTTSNLLVTI